MKYQNVVFALLALMAPISAGATSTTVVVTPNDPQGWQFVHDSGNDDTTVGQTVFGPQIPPRGVGSARFQLGGSEDGLSLALIDGQLVGTRFADITRLEYSTYRDPDYPGEVHAIALQFNIDYDSNDGDDGFQGRIIYEPYYTDTVVGGEWQTWNALNNKIAPTGKANWWFTHPPGNLVCPASLPCTWSKVLATFPNARIDAVSGGVILKAGEGWPENFDGNTDALTIGVSGNDTTFDFEPGLVPDLPDFDDRTPEFPEIDCEEDGPRILDRLPLENPGICVSFVVSEAKKKVRKLLSLVGSRTGIRGR